MKPKRIHHIGIVFQDFAQARAIMDMFEMEVDYQGFIDAYKADVYFTKFGKWESPIEFIIPREGVLTRFNNGKGGIHHICFEVEDTAAATREYTEKGYEMLEKIPVVGACNDKVNFMRPRCSQGVLFEFLEELSPKIRN
jgi:lactoylglutathione lyase/methylmalonyl-CoA/ethylmalonyl-CoA epimerase